jgi:hypothetical protein
VCVCDPCSTDFLAYLYNPDLEWTLDWSVVRRGRRSFVPTCQTLPDSVEQSWKCLSRTSSLGHPVASTTTWHLLST